MDSNNYDINSVYFLWSQLSFMAISVNEEDTVVALILLFERGYIL